MINYLFTFVYIKYIKQTHLKNMLETSFQRLTWGFQGVDFEYHIFGSIYDKLFVYFCLQ